MVLAWHFLTSTSEYPQGVLRTGEPAPADGEWLIFDGYVQICQSGLHASERVRDALKYAPGHILCQVECEDVVDREADKFVCRRRQIIWRINAESVLRAFARRCVLDVSHLWDPPEIVLEWLKFGRETDRENARSAAHAAGALSAVRAALSAAYATQSAAQYASLAAYSAARSASYAVYSAAEFACEATFQEMRKRQESTLVAMIEEARLGKTAWVFD